MDREFSRPSKFGKYLLVERIGRGGMSEVFLAKSTGIEGFERRLALKRIFPSLAANPEFVEGFIHEARIGGMLYHHNVVQTLDFGRCDDTLFIALEYVEGTNLGALLSRCRDEDIPIPPPVFLQIALQICEGLEYIHNASSDNRRLNLVHRDIKPSNMLITAQGIVKISDFGVVKGGIRSSGTTVGALKGTVGYMSPEQARGEPVGPASDIFSLGAMLYEMATFRRLYGEEDLLTVLQRVKTSAFEVPIEAAGAYIPGLDRVLKRMLAPVPGDRPDGAGDVSAALRALPVRVADRKAVVAFVAGLGLLETRDTPASPLESAEGAGEAALEPVDGHRPGPDGNFGHDDAPSIEPPGSSRRWVTVGVTVIFAALGLIAAVGSYHLVSTHLSPSGEHQEPVHLVAPGAEETCGDAAIEVLVRSIPPGATLSVDHAPTTYRTPIRLWACPGQEIEVSMPQYRTWRGIVAGGKGELPATLLATLVPEGSTPLHP